jgi:hypothetical protein
MPGFSTVYGFFSHTIAPIVLLLGRDRLQLGYGSVGQLTVLSSKNCIGFETAHRRISQIGLRIRADYIFESRAET